MERSNLLVARVLRGATGTAGISLRGLTKRFGGVTAVDDLTLDLAPGELVALLGPSGCGKTTTLRMIAGFEVPTEGRVLLGDRDVTEAPPEKRSCGMVFQNYALFPHLTVRQNISFGLEMQGVPRAEIARRVGEILDKVELGGLGPRYPRQLSGGQQQRTALARALDQSQRAVARRAAGQFGCQAARGDAFLHPLPTARV